METIYRLIVVLEYTKIATVGNSYPRGFAQWVEQYFVQTSSSLATAIDAVIKEVRAHNLAYVYIRGIMSSTVRQEGGQWTVHGFERQAWTYGAIPNPVVGAPYRCLMNGHIEPPNALPMPIQIALRHRLVLSSFPGGRNMYHYIRSIHHYCLQNGIRSTASPAPRLYLPRFALQSDVDACSEQHLTAITSVPRLVNNNTVRWVCLGTRKKVPWISRVVGLVEPELVLTARKYVKRTYS